jgi:hypothetical protein
LLRNQAAQIKIHDCKDAVGADHRIALIYAPYSPNGICETFGNSPKA